MGGTAFSLNLGTQLLQAVDAARRQHDLRAGLCQHLCKARTQAAGCTRHQCNFSFKINFNTHLFLRLII